MSDSVLDISRKTFSTVSFQFILLTLSNSLVIAFQSCLGEAFVICVNPDFLYLVFDILKLILELIKILERESLNIVGWFDANKMIENLDKFQQTCHVSQIWRVIPAFDPNLQHTHQHRRFPTHSNDSPALK